jgi:hypothetical protein
LAKPDLDLIKQAEQAGAEPAHPALPEAARRMPRRFDDADRQRRGDCVIIRPAMRRDFCSNVITRMLLWLLLSI